MTMNYPFYNANDDAPTPDQKAQFLVDEVLSYLGPRDVAEILLHGDPEHGVEPLNTPDVRGALSLDEENGITKVTIENVVKADDDAFTSLRNMVLTWSEQAIEDARNSEPFDYKATVEYEVDDYPQWFAYRIIQNELDMLSGLPYDRPEYWGRELALRQLLADDYNVGNRGERLKLWDALLSYTYYEQFFAFELRPSQDSDEVIREDVTSVKRWHQSPTTLHNTVLRRLRRKFDAELEGGEQWLQVTDSDTKPRRRYDSGLEPRDDVTDFVFAY